MHKQPQNWSGVQYPLNTTSNVTFKESKVAKTGKLRGHCPNPQKRRNITLTEKYPLPNLPPSSPSFMISVRCFFINDMFNHTANERDSPMPGSPDSGKFCRQIYFATNISILLPSH